MTYDLKYSDFVEYGREIATPIDSLAVYRQKRKLHCDRGAALSRKPHIKFGVIDLENEEIRFQTRFVDKKQAVRVREREQYAIGFRNGLLEANKQEMEAAQ